MRWPSDGRSDGAPRLMEVHLTADRLRAAAEEASATPPPHQEQRGRPGSACELAASKQISPACDPPDCYSWTSRCS